MPSNYRNQPRQGVVYGPAGPQGGGDRTALLGTLLGVLVVLVAMAMLTVAAFAVIGDLSASPSPSASLIAQSSPSPSPSTGATSSASPAPSGSQGVPPSSSPGGESSPPASPVATPTPPPGSFAPQVQVGPGYVTFGTKTNAKLHITNARATFSSQDPRIMWSAHLTSPADAADLHIHIYELDASVSGGRRLLWDHQLTIHAKGAQIYKSYLRTKTALRGPGIYEVQYLRGNEVLADGFFKFTG